MVNALACTRFTIAAAATQRQDAGFERIICAACSPRIDLLELWPQDRARERQGEGERYRKREKAAAA